MVQRKRYEIEELLIKLQECIDLYRRNYINNKNYTLFLGNGEQIRYYITPNNVAHLLGVNLDYLRQTKKYRCTDNFELLQELCESNYQQLNMLTNGKIDQKQLFSPYIDKKIEGFKSNLNVDIKQAINDIEFVCCYESKNSWDVTTKNQKYDYIIVKRLPNDKITVLCIVINGSKCYAMSNQLFDNFEQAKESFKEILTHQEISLVNSLHTYNTYTDSHFKTFITNNQKAEKLNTMKYYKKMFDCNIDISSDYEYILGLLKDNKSEKNENKDTIDKVVEAIINKNIIERYDFEDSILLDVIDSWNNHICSNSVNATETSITYTDAIKSLEKMKKIISDYEEKIVNLESNKKDLESKIQTLSDDKQSLTTQLEEQNDIITTINELTKPRTK